MTLGVPGSLAQTITHVMRLGKRAHKGKACLACICAASSLWQTSLAAQEVAERRRSPEEIKKKKTTSKNLTCLWNLCCGAMINPVRGLSCGERIAAFTSAGWQILENKSLGLGYYVCFWSTVMSRVSYPFTSDINLLPTRQSVLVHKSSKSIPLYAVNQWITARVIVLVSVR